MQENSDTFRQLSTKQQRFLATFKVRYTVSDAARASGICRDSHYGWLNSDANYKAEFDLLKMMMQDELQGEAYGRAVFGAKRAMFYRGKPVIDPSTGKQYIERVYSDKLLILMLKALGPVSFQEGR